MSCYRALLTFSVFAFLTTTVQAQQPVRASIAVILDCSLSMSEDAASGDGVQEVSATDATRFDSARAAMGELLQKLSADGNYHAAVYFFGHRLKWEGEDEPQLTEQTDYLGMTDGFKVLTQLTPGDDVELIQPLGSIDDTKRELITARLEAVKAWGESPLYLAVNQAVDALSADDHAAPKGIIVLTSGTNKQWVARSRRSKQDILRAVANQPHLGIYFVSYGPKPEDEAAAEMNEIAAATGGSVETATIADVLSRIESSGGSTGKTVSEGGPPVRNVQGRVLYFGKPVRKARVLLVGSGMPPVQTDTTGTFLFQGVMPGNYTIDVEGIAKNQIRNAAMDLTVPIPSRDMPGITIDLP